MTEEFSFYFGVEEFSVALSLIKRVDEARGLMISTFGKLSQEEEKGRLLAAYNSLFARKLITFDGKDTGLHPNITKLLDIFFSSHKLIKVGKAVDSGEDLVSYYFHEGTWLEHSVTQGVAYRFHYPINEPEISEKISMFLSPTAQTKVAEVSINLPSDLILNAPTGTLGNYKAVMDIIRTGSSKITPTMEQLATDITSGRWRGSTIWMDRPTNDDLLSKGYLWVQGKDRLWVINSNPSSETNTLIAQLCNLDDFNKKIQELVFTKTNV